MNKKNSLIFSVTYENYMNNVLNDKENKSLGQWRIAPEMTDGNSSMEVMPSIDTFDLSPESKQ